MRHILSAALIASFAVSVAAQQPATQGQQPATPSDRPAIQGERPTTTPGQQPTTRAESPASTQAAKTTIAGCIQTAPPSPVAAGAPAAPAASKFELANAKGVSSGGAVGTTGAAPTSMRYRLEGDEKTISAHLNHQVEITGTVSPATAGSAGATGATAATPMLKVESVKMVAATCATAEPGTTTPGR